MKLIFPSSNYLENETCTTDQAQCRNVFNDNFDLNVLPLSQYLSFSFIGKKPWWDDFWQHFKITSVNVGSSSQLEVHSNSWLSDLQLGQATKILQKEENSSVQLSSQVFNNIPDVSPAQAAHCILALTRVSKHWRHNASVVCSYQLSHSVFLLIKKQSVEQEMVCTNYHHKGFVLLWCCNTNCTYTFIRDQVYSFYISNNNLVPSGKLFELTSILSMSLVSGSTSMISRSSAEICSNEKVKKLLRVQLKRALAPSQRKKIRFENWRVLQRRGGKVCWDLRDVVVSPLPLLLLELDGDSSDGAALDPFHQVGHISET